MSKGWNISWMLFLKLEDYIKGSSLKEFMDHSMMRFACIKQIEIIGEAANYITPVVRKEFPDIQWAQITGMRHILVHEFFGIDTLSLADHIK